MSYILDALKKAEAERKVGGVPSIHAAATGNAAATEETSSLRKFLPWIIVGLLVLIMLAYVLWSQPWSRNEPAPVATALPATAAPAPAIVGEPAPAAQAAVQAPAPVPAPVEKPVHAVVSQAVAEKPKAEDAKPVASAATPAPTSPPVAANAASAASAAAPEEEAGTVQDLPPNIQRELPPVTINGYIYARNPADRSALINKKLLHEGENIAPDLVLEKLTPKGAVLNFKGYRYRISY